ncbi:HipA domain-containing protein [Trinickia dinghuensis]|uniref:Type II toxin-antitoxin system HipA family toxin n=1 Tax=Trinickia dinghuensis TaxID=2291023 RepID=A0A3D8JVW0_9BURK|nr:HipA domain-containing protein [Trinickia dinghuensis]RDU96855.1 type II toxin-antitoxin system HipA family toxin [Trinickia dinghuensis]
MPIRELVAWANGERMGVVADNDDIWSFTYDPQWLASKSAFPMSPAFPLRQEPFIDGSSNRPVQWFFDNLLPEEGMRQALAREAKIDGSDAWGLLGYYGRESAGALTLLAPDENEPPGALRPLSFADLETRIIEMPHRPLTADAPKRMSAAGAQPKLLVTMRGQPPVCELFEPEGSAPSMQLLKPDSRSAGYPHSAINEFFCMRLARAVALPVPATHFVRVPTPCYIVDRFDRDTTAQPTRRLHVIDAAQLLNFSKDYKYDGANAQRLREAIDRTSTRANTRLEIFRWAVFNVLVGNGDAHLKNLSFFVTPLGYRLAPFYDIVSTVVYHTRTYQPERADQWPNCELTMQVGAARHFADISRQNMLKLAEELGLPGRGAERLLDEMLEVFRARVDETFEAVVNIATPDAGEMRLLNSIRVMPIAEMSRALTR